MGYVVRYSTSNINKTRRKGNAVIGVDSGGYSKTSESGFYAGVPPVAGKHNVVRVQSSGDPDFYVLDDSELINLANQLGGSVSTTTAATVYLAGRDDIIFTNNVVKNTVTDGLVLELDASNLSSYPGSGSTWYDLSGNSSNGTISSTPTFNENGYLEFDGSSNYIDLGSNITLSKNNSTFSGWFYIEDFTTLSGAHTQQARSLAYGPATNHLALIAAWDGGYGFENDINSSPYEVNSTNDPPVPASDITSQKWFNFVLSFISGTARGYVNGELISTVGSPNDLTIRYLGIAATNTNYPDYLYGNMANVRVYNKGLSESEVKQNYYGGDIVTDGLTFAIDTSNLISYESGSTVVSPLTGSISGDLVNGPTFNSMNNGVLEFDGANDRLTFSHNSEFDVSGPFTIDLWFYGGSGVDNYGGLFNKSGNGNFGNWGLYGDSENRYVRFGYVSTNGSQRECNNSNYSDIDTAGWYYYCGTYDGSTLKLYRNGVQIASNNVTSTHQTPATTTTDVGFGYRPGSSAYEVNYKIGAARLYNNKALSSDEVLQNYNAQKARFI